MNRRQWLRSVLSAGFALPLLQACKFWEKGPRSGSVAESVSTDAAWIFGTMGDTQVAKQSFLYWLDLPSAALNRYVIPIHDAHHSIIHPNQPEILIILGLESDTLCLFDLKKKEIHKTIKIENKVFSGHATFRKYNGEDTVFFTQYEKNNPKNGSVAVRRLSDFSLVTEFSSEGVYPHVIVTHVKANEIIVQNLGHKAGNESYSPTSVLTVFDGDTLKLKRKVNPGRQGERYTFLGMRTGNSQEAKKFRLTAEYQMDSKRTFYPDRKLLVTEHPEMNSITLWSPQGKVMLTEISLGSDEPTHALYPEFFPHYLVYGRKQGLHLIDKKTRAVLAQHPKFSEFQSSMHINVYPRKDFT